MLADRTLSAELHRIKGVIHVKLSYNCVIQER